MKDWHVQYHSDEYYPTKYALICEEVPWWARFVTTVCEFIDVACKHAFCNPPGWSWHIPIGFPKFDPNDASYLDNALGNYMSDLFQHVMRFEEHYTETVVQLDLTEEQMVANKLDLEIF